MRSLKLFIPVMPSSTNRIYAGQHFHVVTMKRSEAAALGLKFYFTGRRCPKGHIATRYVNGTACTACSSLYREKNRAKAAKAAREWRKNNPQRQLDMSRAAYKKNREREIERRRKRYRENIESERAVSKAWRQKNKDIIYIKNRRYVSENIEANRAYWRNSSAKRRAAMSRGMTSRELSSWTDAQEKTCFWCGIDVRKGFHVDHYIPLSRGGLHEADNLRISCRSCNCRKHNKMPDEFLKDIGDGE